MGWLRRLVNTVRSARLSADLDREVRFHLAERADELQARGLPPAEAARQARLRFGNPTVQRDDTREVDLVGWLDSVLRDVRYAIRGLRRAPAFTAVAIGSLGLGIGVNTTIFTLIDAVVLRDLPVSRAGELFQIQGGTGGDQDPYLTNPLWESIRNRQDVFTTAAAFGETLFNLAESGVVRRAVGGYVSGTFFTTFEVTPAVGRLFSRSDDVRGCPGIAVLGYRFWRREYAGAADVVGRAISLTGQPFTIVGVAAESFRGVDVGREPDVYAPLCSEAIVRGASSALDRRSHWFLRVVGRARSGATLEVVDRGLRAISRDVFAETVPGNWGVADQGEYRRRTLRAAPVSRGFSDLRTRYGSALMVLMAAVGLVLMIACANVANLLLARAESRQRELAIRLAIGAGRRRLARQLLTESLFLAAAGTALGVALSGWATPAMVGLIPAGRIDAVSLDLDLNGRILGFTAALAAVTVLVFGLLPAWRASRVDAQLTLKSGGRVEGAGPSRIPIGKALVTGQVAISLLLVVGAGLLIGTLRRLSSVAAGFEPGGVLLVDVDFRRAGLPPDGLAGAERDLLERARTVPGVTGAATIEVSPVSGASWNDEIMLEGFTGRGAAALSLFNEVSEGYFTTMRTRLLAGRDFGPGDTPGSARVAIVNDAWARRFVGGASPLGRTFRTRIADSASAPITVVGVVENAKYRSLREADEATVYLARSQRDTGPSSTVLAIRAAADPAALPPLLTPALTEARAGITLDYRVLTRQLAGSLQRERMLAILSGLFGGLALALATLGLYGVMSYAVARRKGELGVRIALGASPAAVIRLVLGEVAAVVGAGLVLGGLAATVLTRLLGSFLYGIEPGDPSVLLGAAATLAGVALLAGLIPARRAARVDPLETLREQ